MTTRHEFLAQLHELLKPRVYLEVGVQLGTSLRLAHAAELAIGIDPHPLTAAQGNERIYSMTADGYFAGANDAWDTNPHPAIDLAFIDGSHLFEDALRDFISIERYAHTGTVVVFDDVLPYSAAIAGRDIIPGDWTGDVWKVEPILRMLRPELNLRLVDVMPTGALVVWGFGGDPWIDDLLTPGWPGHDQLIESWIDLPVPDHVISRGMTVTPDVAIERLISEGLAA